MWRVWFQYKFELIRKKSQQLHHKVSKQKHTSCWNLYSLPFHLSLQTTPPKLSSHVLLSLKFQKCNRGQGIPCVVIFPQGAEASEKDEIGTAQTTARVPDGAVLQSQQHNLMVVLYSWILGSKRQNDDHRMCRKSDTRPQECQNGVRSRPSTPSCSWLLHFPTFTFVKVFFF